MDVVKYTKDSSFQKIKAWYVDENSVVLSKDDEEKKDRLVHLWSLRLNNKYSRNQAIQIVMREHNVSQSTAYRDYTLSMQLFGELDDVNIAAERMVLADSFWNLYQMALKKGNEDAAIKALREYKSLFNFQDTTQKVDPKKLEASIFNIKVHRDSAKLMEKMILNGAMDFMSLGAEDAVFKEVSDEELDENVDEYGE